MNALELRAALIGVPDDAEVVVIYGDGSNDAGCYPVESASMGSGGPTNTTFFLEVAE